MESFGEKLRKQREDRGITLEAVANTTKISTRMLKALEDEHFDQLPGGVFNKGFVRAYARQVGLDEEEAINDYLAALAESQVNAQPIQPNFRAARHGQQTAPSAVPTRGRNTTDDRRIHPDRRAEVRRSDDRQNGHSHDHGQIDQHQLRDRVLNINLEDRRSLRPDDAGARTDHAEGSREDIASAPPSFLNLSTPSEPHNEGRSEPALAGTRPERVRWQLIAIPVVVITLSLALWTYRRNHRLAEAQPTAASQVAASPLSAPTSAKPPAAPAATSPTAASLPGTSNPQAEPDSDVTTSPAHAQVSRPKALPTFTLVIRASETSWIAITADGQTVAQETLIAPANTSVRAAHEITVKAGNAAGVSFMLNGKEFPAEGNPGEVRTYTFDANGLRDSAGAPTAAQQP